MVPPESFSIEAPHSSIDFCNGCDGGTQCESFSSKVLSCAEAVPKPSARARASAVRPHNLIVRTGFMIFLPPDVLLLLLPAFNRRMVGSYSDCLDDIFSDRVAASITCLLIPGRNRGSPPLYFDSASYTPSQSEGGGSAR